MEGQPTGPTILLLHDGELADVRGVLGHASLVCTERYGEPTEEDLGTAWDLVVASPHRMLELERGQGKPPTIGVAVLEAESRTVRAALRRAGIDYIVRRPVHPEALRLLFVHALYEGPEKRRQRRVSVGAAVRFRMGWRRHSGLLADLSVTGCRLMTERSLPTGRKLTLLLPPELAGGRGLRVRGRVVRRVAAETDGRPAVGLVFEALSARNFKRLQEIVGKHREGPAVYGASAAPSERREEPRHELDRHIIALGTEAAPVLMGRDISIGGMRVDQHPNLSVGDQLQLAIHVRAREEPLVVRARVTQDNGPRGFVLEFYDLSESARKYLEKMVNFLPILALRNEGGEAGVIVSEILAQTS